MKTKALVYAVDDSTECLLQLVMSLKSVRRYSKEPIDAYILTNKPKSWMNDLYGAKVVDVSQLVIDYGLDKMELDWRGNPVPPMLLFRLLIPVVEELKGYDQVLYLDTDTEVWSSEFFDIFTKDNEGHEITAVKDSLSGAGAVVRTARVRDSKGTTWKDPPDIFNKWDAIAKREVAYVNSGVLVFDMPKLINGYDKRIRYILNVVKTLKPYYSDQEALNVYFDIFAVVDRKFNGWRGKSEGAFLRHYVGNDRRGAAEYPLIAKFRPNDFLDGVEENKNLGVFSGVVDHVYILVDDSNPSDFEFLGEWLLSNGVTDYTKIATKDTGKYSGLLNIVPCDKGIHPEHMENWMGHYKAIVDASLNGYDKIAVFEDSFNPKGLEEHLKELPPDFDLAICTGSDGFKKASEFSAESSKGYIVSKKSIVDLRRLFEGVWDPNTADRRLRYMHKWLHNKIMVKSRTYIRAQ